jgi:C4-dicarboxylate transporter DctM subunit|nr:hypothetical protein [uncultured Acetatifactor sp.]
MPIEVWYIIALIVAICILFLAVKRPIYECMFWGYVLMVIMAGQAGHFFEHIIKTSTDTLFYVVIAFLVLAKILDATHATDLVVNVIIAVVGRFRGALHIRPSSEVPLWGLCLEVEPGTLLRRESSPFRQ